MAFVQALVEMVNGISFRKVTAITKKNCAGRVPANLPPARYMPVLIRASAPSTSGGWMASNRSCW